MVEALTSTADGSRDFLLAEFSALRAEIVKRTEIQHQLISLALIAAGTFLATEAEIAVVAYPILAFFLAAGWVQNDIQIARLGAYIGQRLEPRLLNGRGGWESVWASTPDEIEALGSLAHLASRGVFLGSQAAMLVASLLTYRLDHDGALLFRWNTLTSGPLTLEARGVLLLVLADVVAMILTLYIMRRHRGTLKEKKEWFNAPTGPADPEPDAAQHAA